MYTCTLDPCQFIPVRELSLDISKITDHQKKVVLGGSSYFHNMGPNHGGFRSLVPHGIRHYEISFDTAKNHSILIKKAILHTALPEQPKENVLRSARLG